MIASKISSEERIMKETFREQYIQYQKRVPQLVPGIQFLPGRGKKLGTGERWVVYGMVPGNEHLLCHFRDRLRERGG